MITEGSQVIHTSFGNGVVESINGDKANVRFENGMVKEVALSSLSQMLFS